MKMSGSIKILKEIVKEIMKSELEIFENGINRIKIEKLRKIIRKRFKKLEIIKIRWNKNISKK